MISALMQRLERANEAYRNGTPILSDAEYDALENELRFAAAFATPEERKQVRAFLARVGAPAPQEGWQKVKHRIPMTSLNKAQDEAELRSWAEGVGEGELFLMDKLDGISISLRYEAGALRQALTRGDGKIGEDITKNVLLMQVPTRIPDPDFTGFVRGEVICLRSMHAQHFPEDSNPRNTASGTAKRLHDNRKCRYLTIVAFQWLPDSGDLPRKQDEVRALQAAGFTLPRTGTLPDAEAVQRAYQDYIDRIRDTLDYDIDGLVIALDDNQAWRELGEKNHRPAGSVAYKFPHEALPTTLKGIRWQVGKSGRVTPVADFEVVDLAGAQVRKASLHNAANIARIASEAGYAGFRVGDRITVSRRNDVIPYVEALLVSREEGELLRSPEHCPRCGAAIRQEGEYLICPALETCPAQQTGLVKRWVKEVGILGWGEAIIDGLCEQAIIQDPADLYTLQAPAVAAVEIDGRRIGDNAHHFLKDLHAKREMPLHVLVGSLGIPLMGRSMCKRIVDAGYDTVEALQQATVEELEAIHELGRSKAEAFREGFDLRYPLIQKLLANGVTLQAPASGPMLGLSVCLTGFRDPAMVTAIEAQGGVVKSGVSKALSLLVCKDPSSTSGKVKKAKSYGVEILSIEAMWERLGGRP